MKGYYIEGRVDRFNNLCYRWRSKVTGAKGDWISNEDTAKAGGEEHTSILNEIIEKLAPEKKYRGNCGPL